MKTKVTTWTFFLCFAVGLTSSAWADPAPVKQVKEKPVIVFDEGTAGKPMSLKKIKANFDTPNSIIGELQTGWFCRKKGDIAWNKKVYDLFASKMGRAFKEELEAAHYPVTGTKDAVFDSPREKTEAENLQAGVLFKEVKVNLCLKDPEVLGGVYMKLFWQIYSPEAKKVVFETTTEGTFQPGEAVKVPLDGFFLNAFRAAVRNLLAEKGLSETVKSSANNGHSHPKQLNELNNAHPSEVF